MLTSEIDISREEKYKLNEVIEMVKELLDKVSEHAGENKLRYSKQDVYWLLFDLLRYANRSVPGEFSLNQLRKDIYRVEYQPETSGAVQGKRKLAKDLKRTAKYIEELTGRPPAWANYGDTGRVVKLDKAKAEKHGQ